jgi:hypothetical protein
LDNVDGIIMDTYLDKTFGWDSEFYNVFNVIPFRKPWVGFIHHTFAENYSANNAKTLIHSPLFIQSLATCKGIFVLSQDLKNKLIEEFKTIIVDCPIPEINVLFHPTEIPLDSQCFTMEKFIKNRNKKLIQVRMYTFSSDTIGWSLA